ncbi:hypothetical protein EBT25_15720, partial [bacterium]|nr:hypothetical protein [bacterium]
MNEQDFLKNFAKILNVENKFEEMEQQRLKEQKMLERFGAALGVKVVQEERTVPESLITKAEVIQHIADQLPDPEPIVEDVIPPNPVLPVKDIVTKSVEKIATANPKDVQSVLDKIPASIRKELDILKKSITDLHSLAIRQSQMGGGGAVLLNDLDDVSHSSVIGATDGQVLTYNATTGKWIAATPSSGGAVSNTASLFAYVT